MITQDYLKSRLRYDPETGHFVWISLEHGTRMLGKRAGVTQKNGYVYIMIDGKSYLAHRLAFLYVHGFLPRYLDHINRTKDDNRVANLRECTHSQNLANSKDRKSKTGVRGVCFQHGKYRALIRYLGNAIYLGTFTTAEEASAAYRAKKAELFKGFDVGL